MTLAVTYTVFGDMVVKENRGGVESFYMADTLGSTSQLVDANGNVTDTFTYWPYGEIRTRTGTTNTPYTFIGTLGYYFDAVMNWFYVRARYYLPNVGRWLTVDPLWPKEKGYAYALANPTTNIDPFGLNVAPSPIKCDPRSNDLVIRICFGCRQSSTPGCRETCNRLAAEYYFQCCLQGKKPGPCRRYSSEWFPVSGVGVAPFPTIGSMFGEPPQGGPTIAPIAPTCSYLAVPCTGCQRNRYQSNGSVDRFDVLGCKECCATCSGDRSACLSACDGLFGYWNMLQFNQFYNDEVPK